MHIPSLARRLVSPFRDSSRRERPRNLTVHSDSLQGHQVPPLDQGKTSGIQTLPVEVLEVVFWHVIHDWGAYLRYLTHIGLTCRRWRAAVLSSASLWSHLPPICETPTGTVISPDIQRLLSTTKLFLERSGDRPLHFQFHVLMHPFRGEEEPLAQILLLLVSQCHRWEDVSLSIGLQLLETATRISGKLPILRSLYLTVLTPKQGSGTHTVNHFAHCPSLRHVSLTVTSRSEAEEVKVNLPWSQVNDFNDFKSVPAGVRRFQQLGDATAGIECWMSTRTLSFIQREFSGVCAGDITKLSLTTSTSPAILEWFARKLTLPKLIDLELCFQSHDVTCLPLTDLYSFVRRSKCSLKQLYVDRAFCEPGVLSQILSLCGDDMEEMTVPIIPAEDLRQLTLDPSGARLVLVPKLRALEVLVNHMSYGDIRIFDGSALTEMALSRDSQSGSRQRDSVAALGVRVRAPWRAVETLRLMFHRLEENSHSPERGPVIGSTREGVEKMIAGWSGTLHELCLPHEAPRWKRLKPTLRHDLGEPFDRVLKEMESYPVVELDVMLLRKYSIPKILDHGRCSTLSPTCGPCERVYKVSARLEAIRESWPPTIASEVASYHRWVVTGACEWAYLPLGSGRRQGDEPWFIATSRLPYGQTASDSPYHDLP